MVNAARDDDVEGSFGKILKKAMSPEEVSKKTPRLRKISLFAHPTRQKIFCYLCEKPCSHLRQIARDLGIAAPTAEWHLRKFVEKGVLKVKVMENKHVFYPSNMIDANDINIIWNLNNERARMIYETIMDSPGITQIKICETLNLYQQIVACSTMQLEEVGLIRSQREGRSKRYFITKHPKEMLRSSQQRRKYFRDWVLRILREEGLNPKVLRARNWELKVAIEGQKKTSVMTINCNPLSSIFAKFA